MVLVVVLLAVVLDMVLVVESTTSAFEVVELLSLLLLVWVLNLVSTINQDGSGANLG